jgi:LysM repeat protein
MTFISSWLFDLGLLSLLGSSFFFTSSLVALPTYPAGINQDRRQPPQQSQTGLSAIKHQLSNHESEIRMMEEKLNNQEETIETLRQGLCDTGQLHRDLLKDNQASLNSKIDSLDTKTKNLVTDLGVLKTHANESAAILEQYKHKIKEMEKVTEVQKNQLNHLEEAIRSLMDLMQVKESLGEKGDGVKSYRVQSGDTLEKIARSQKVTIQALREKNNLTNDKIMVGQKLMIP